ncbi:MAG: amino acid ABC transporter permease [Clostridia bacterium]|nr:amino acid ABC transporter permease [Clostridia bacterium]
MLVDGLTTTLKISGVSCVAGVVLGSVIALMRLSKNGLLRGVSTLYVNVVRGTPVVVQLMIIYYIVLAAPSKIVAAMVTFSVNSAAYVSEMVRGGILAVDKGQTEAGRSLGLGAASTMLLIVLPQTIKIIIPSLFNEFITLLKETSVVGFIGLMDLSKAGDFIRSRTYSAFFPLIAVAVIYLVLVTILTKVFGIIEGRLRKSDIR